ncbi:MAG: ABC transporter substrate-binding protein [Armatimonadota bacterium]|nr:ABC transporter substrate-binding protein [Armatimonadota bacterium]
MQRIFKTALWLAPLCFVFTGCGGKPDSDTSTTTSDSSAAATSDSSASATSGSTSAGASSDAGAAPASGPAITIGYSDWPGWTCWDIADQKGFFKKHGVNVKLVWFPNYTDSLNALAAGKVDANCQTWSDSMGPLAEGEPLKAVLVNDNSFGNDAVIAKPGITSVKQLRGKKVATELGTVDHFLLLKALEANGMTEKDVKFTNIKVQDCPAAMLGGAVDAVVVWEPSRSKLLHDMKGSTVVYDSTQVPGLIPDLLVVQSKVVESRPADIQKIVDAWYDMLGWWKTHPDEAVQIMAKRTSSPVSFYQGFIKGTRIFSAPEALTAMTKGPGVDSLYTSGDQVAKFLLKVDQVKKVPDYGSAIDPQFIKAALDKGLGKSSPYTYNVKIAQAP